MVARRYAPDRTVYLAYGHDEEVGGTFGATAIARLLQSRGVQLEFVLDEGGIVILDGVPPFVAAPVGIIGTAEKVGHPMPSLRVAYITSAKMPAEMGMCMLQGYSLTEVHFRSPGGHSAMPPVTANSVRHHTLLQTRLYLSLAHNNCLMTLCTRLQIASMVGRLFAALDRRQTPLTLVAPMPDFFIALASGAKYRGVAWLLRNVKNPCAILPHFLPAASLMHGPSLLPAVSSNRRLSLAATQATV